MLMNPKARFVPRIPVRTLPYVAMAGLSTLGSALAQGRWTAPAPAQTGGIDVGALDTELNTGLGAGRDSAAVLTCTAFGVFLANGFVQLIFGIAFLVSIAMALYGWYSQARNGVGAGRLFWLIVVFMAGIAVIGFLFVTVMGCNPQE